MNKISANGMKTKGKRSHITIADYGNLDIKNFIKLAEKYYDDKFIVELTLSVLGTFINTRTLSPAPTSSTDLLKFHQSHHNHFGAFNEDEGTFYLPNKWSPHCTIAIRLDEDTMIQTFSYIKTNIDKISCRLDTLALIELKLNN